MADLPPTLDALKGTRVGQIMKPRVKRGRVSKGAGRGDAYTADCGSGVAFPA